MFPISVLGIVGEMSANMTHWLGLISLLRGYLFLISYGLWLRRRWSLFVQIHDDSAISCSRNVFTLGPIDYT